MLFQRFFKQPKPNKFGYSPVFYDQKKIERDRKIKEADAENKERISSVNFKSKFKNELDKSRENSMNQFRARERTKSNKTLFIIIFVIAAIVYVQLKF